MKSISLTVEMVFDVPDDTNVNKLYVEFPSGAPVVRDDSGPVENGSYSSHQTTMVDPVEDDDDDDFSDDDVIARDAGGVHRRVSEH